MNNGKNNQNIRLKGMFVIKCVIVMMAGMTIATMSASKDWIGIFMNLLFLAGMTFLIMRAEKKGIVKMLNTGEDCQKIYTWIVSVYKNEMTGDDLWKTVVECPVSFRDEVVDRDWKQYLAVGRYERIENYLDEDKLYEQYEKGFCDLIPGLLTALGILGTFFGLILSINSFDFDTVDALEMALENIVGGMNVAFYTSVYGVMLSVLFNPIYKNYQKKFSASLYELQSSLNRYFNVQTSGETEIQMLGYIKSVEKKLEDIKEIWQTNIASEIGETISESLEPIFEEITRSLNRVIGDFREEQSVSLQSVVESFVQRMYSILDAHIYNLGKSVDRLSESQVKMSTEMSNLLAEITKTAFDTKTINNESEIILKKFESYMDKINEMIEVANKTFTAVENYSREMYSTSVRQQSIANNLEGHEKQLVTVCGDVISAHQEMAVETSKNIELVRQICEREIQMAEKQERLMECLDKYSEGTMTIFAEMKAAQLSASAQYQKSWKMLDGMFEYQKKNSADIEGNVMYDKALMNVINEQTRLLGEIQRYYAEKEEKTIKNRVFRIINRFTNKSK